MVIGTGTEIGSLCISLPSVTETPAADTAVKGTATDQATSSTCSLSVQNRASGNMLQRNFFQQNYEQSRYVQGTMLGHRIENEFANNLLGIISKYRIEAELAEGGYAGRGLAGSKAARETEEAVKSHAAATMEEELEETREEQEAEQKAELERSGSQESTEAVDAKSPGLDIDAEADAEATKDSAGIIEDAAAQQEQDAEQAFTVEAALTEQYETGAYLDVEV